MPLMSLMSVSIKEEAELAKLTMERLAPTQNKSGKVSAFGNSKPAGYAPITTP